MEVAKKIIHGGNNSEIYSFKISENREHFVSSFPSVCLFFFAKNRNTQFALLWPEITIQRFHGKYSVHDVSLEMGRKEKLKANRCHWKEVTGQSYRFCSFW